MTSFDFSRFTLSIAAATAMLAGCGGSKPPIGAPGAMPQTSAIATRSERGKSHGDLVYVLRVLAIRMSSLTQQAH